VKDRVVQMAAKLVLPVFAADLMPSSYGYGRSGARRQRWRSSTRRPTRAITDIREYFARIAHDKLLKLVAKRVSERRVLKLLRRSKPV